MQSESASLLGGRLGCRLLPRRSGFRDRLCLGLLHLLLRLRGSELLFVQGGAFFLEHVQEGLGGLEDFHEGAFCFLDCSVILVSGCVLA